MGRIITQSGRQRREVQQEELSGTYKVLVPNRQGELVGSKARAEVLRQARKSNEFVVRVRKHITYTQLRKLTG